MKKLQTTILLAALLLGQQLFAQSSVVIREYIRQFKDIAMDEMKRTGVPAAITLAQGIHETSAGQSVLVRKSNNHFGIKCKENWQGPSVRHDDDARQECFRKYESPDESYRDHSDFLKTRRHYAFLFTLDPIDFEGWAYGLKKAGYATNPKYPQILIKLIRDYSLQDYTLVALGQKNEGPDALWAASTHTPAPVRETQKTTTAATNPETPVAYPAGVFRINDTKVVYVPKGTSYLSVAEAHGVSLQRLFDFNDLQPQELTATDQLLYLQRKRKSGAGSEHTVAPGETLQSIAQTEGIRLESLLRYNFLSADMQPAVGEVLQLRRKASDMPRLATAATARTQSFSDDAAETTAGTASMAAEYRTHVVQPRETLYAIAKKYAVRVEDLMKWNDLSAPGLKTGQSLRIKKS